MKTKKILESLVDIQKSINLNLKELNKNILESVAPKIKENEKQIFGIMEKMSNIETNVFTKKETIEKINTEYDYRKEYEECKEKNEHLLYIIEKYWRYDNKYEVLKIFNEINKEYGVLKRG